MTPRRATAPATNATATAPIIMGTPAAAPPVFKADVDSLVIPGNSAPAAQPITRTNEATTFAQAMDAAIEQGEGMGGVFSPGVPLTPFDGVSGVPRAWNFPTGYNIKSRADRDGRMAFTLLKSLTDNYDVASMCINHRIDDVRSLNWTVRAADWAETDDPQALAAARKALKRPDGVNPFRSWLAMFLGDILRYDAGALYRRRDFIGRVCALEVVSGITIAPVLDYYGRRPAAPAPAYVQYVNGMPWMWLTADDLIYVPFRPQTDSPYGQAPLETVLLTANTHMRFQKHYLDWFTEGNIPEGFATAPQDITTPEQLAKWQEYWSAMNTGDTTAKHQLRMIPHGTTLEFPKEQDFNPEFPLHLMRVVCAAFHVTPNDLGFTEDVNRATGDTQVDVQFRIGTLPLVRHIEDILTDYLQEDLGLPVVFEFDTGQETEDRVATAQADQIYIQNGVISVDEVREREFGLATDTERPTPRFIFSAREGPIPLRSLLDIAGPIDPQTAAPSEALPLDTTAFSGTPGVLPDKAPGQPQFARAPINPDEPERPELEQEVPGSGIVQPPAPAPAPAAVAKELSKWQSNTATRLARGQRPRRFESDVVPAPMVEAIWKQLRHVTDRTYADVLFTVVKDTWTDLSNLVSENDDPDSLDDVPSPESYNTQEYDAHDSSIDDFDQNQPDWAAEEDELTDLETGGDTRPKGQPPVATGRATGMAGRVEQDVREAWRKNPDKPTAQMEADLKLIDFWGPKITDVFADAFGVATFREIVHNAREGYKEFRQAEFDASKAGQALKASRLKDVMDAMWADAYSVGKMAAQVDIMGPTDDWKAWNPGQLGELPRLSDVGWMQAMASKGLTIQGIEDSTMKLIGNKIDEGVKAGWSVDQLARALQDTVTDPKRAEMIAHTESARMLTAASLTQYREAGIVQWDLVTSAGACEECRSIEMDNPHSAYDDEDAPPIHPRCRCSVSPHDAPTLLTDPDGKHGELTADDTMSDEQRALAGEAFHTAFESAMKDSPYTAFVSHYSADEIAGMKDIVLAEGGDAGMLIKDHHDGRIEGSALFNQSNDKQVGRQLLDDAINKYGVNYVECYGPFLPKLYESLGFQSVEQYPFDRSMAADNWNYGKFGEPDYHMMTKGGVSYAELAKRAGIAPQAEEDDGSDEESAAE